MYVGNLSKVQGRICVWFGMIITHLTDLCETLMVRMIELNINQSFLMPGNESAEAITSDCGCVLNRLLFRFEVVVLDV